MKTKKILSVVLTAILAMQCTSLASFAEESNTADEVENIYLLNHEETDGYGYINFDFVDKNGDVADFDPTAVNTNSGSVNMLNANSTEFPTRYNLNNLGYVTDVREQGVSKNCWAFAALGSLESNALVQGKETPDFSEAHLVWFAHRSATTDINSPVYGDGINRSDPYDSGGNWLYAVAALSKWSGTVSETDYPFYPLQTYRMGNYSESERYNTSGGTIIASAEHLGYMSDIKSWIMENGAVEASFYYDDAFVNMTDSSCAYFCNNESLESNHAILIVGWDDYYSKNNFRSDIKPAYSGAFLCKNSWGSDWGEDGYFWISYFDDTLGGMVGYTGMDADTYDYNYTYNGMGYGAKLECTSSKGAQVANVFTSNGHEKLSGVSLYTYQDSTYAEVFIYKNLPETYTKPNQGTLVYSSKKINIPYAGYHTLSIDNPVSLNPDEIFSVVIRYSSSTGKVTIPIEYEKTTNVFSSSPRQSYADTSGTGSNWFDMTSQGWDNACIQVFTECEHQPCESTTSATCIINGNVTVRCSQCGEEITSYEIVAAGHTFSEWVTTKEASRTSEGEKIKTCETCGQTEIQIIPQIIRPTSRRVTPNQFMEILKMWFDNFFSRIAERQNKQNNNRC